MEMGRERRQRMAETAQRIEAPRSVKAPIIRRDKGRKRGPHKVHRYNEKSRLNLAPPWHKGKSANPSGLPGTDLAAKAAREFFERYPEGIGKRMAEELKGFNAYAYGVLADRAYGKLRQQVEYTGSIEVVQRLISARKRVAEKRES